MRLFTNSHLQALLLAVQFLSLTVESAPSLRTQPSKRYSSSFLTPKTEGKSNHLVLFNAVAVSNGIDINSLEYLIDGTAFPHIPFDIGESYGGNLPISRSGVATNTTGSSSNTTEQQLFFWFFPSENPAATDEIMIWLNGGVSQNRPATFS